jgi:beta-lactam-binding protein with PASTA domain
MALAAGCGGGTSEPVPDVVGERLDVAKSRMDDAGYGTEEIGGGTFGIVVESNWTVCETDPTAGASGGGDVKLIVDRSCRSSADSDDAASTEAETVAEEESTVDDEPAQPAPEPAVRRVRVPSVVGMDHQVAPNRMQAAGLFNLRERDATGQGRLLIWDRNWVVVEQQPAPSARVSEGHKITLFAVKDGEQ